MYDVEHVIENILILVCVVGLVVMLLGFIFALIGFLAIAESFAMSGVAIMFVGFVLLVIFAALTM